jgi:hypothetical protein
MSFLSPSATGYLKKMPKKINHFNKFLTNLEISKWQKLMKSFKLLIGTIKNSGKI